MIRRGEEIYSTLDHVVLKIGKINTHKNRNGLM